MSVMLVKCVILLQHWRFFSSFFFLRGGTENFVVQENPCLNWWHWLKIALKLLYFICNQDNES